MRWRAGGYYVGSGTAELLACGVAAARLGVAFRSAFPGAGYLYILLRDVMSERGVQQRPLAVTLQELQRICDTLAHHHQPAAHELAAIIWRLHCSLSQLEQAPAQGTLSPGYLMTPQA